MKKIFLISVFSFSISFIYAQKWCIPKNGLNANPTSMIAYKNKLYFSGSFSLCGSVSTYGLAHWDGTNWTDISTVTIGTDHNYFSIIDNNLYLLPKFRAKIKIWDGTTMTYINNIFDLRGVKAAVKFQGALHVAGAFRDVTYDNGYGGNAYTHPSRIALKQGIKFNAVGSGLFGVLGTGAEVEDLAIYKDELYVAGYFKRDVNNTMLMGNIGRWNGTRWDSLGKGFNHLSFDLPTSLCVDTINDFLYVAGQFSKAGGIVSNTVARWNGKNWESLNCPMPGDSHFATKAIFYHKELYIGHHGYTGSSVDTLLAKWSGKDWTFITGLCCDVNDMEVFRDTLYLGNISKLFDTIPIPNFIGYYDTMPTHCHWLISRIYANTDTLTLGDTISFENNNKYASSWAWDFGDGNTANIQKPEHAYQNSGVYTASVIVHQENCYDTAYFTVNVLQTALPKAEEKPKTYVLGNCNPNPTRGTSIINYQIPPETQIAEIWISDLQGKTLEKHRISVYDTAIELDFSHLKANTYLFTLFADGKVRQSKRMAVVK